MTKKKILITGSIITVGIVGLLGFMTLSSSSLEKTVDTFLTTINQDDYETAYNYLNVPEDILKSEKALKSTLNDLGLNVDEMKSFNTKLVEDKSNKEKKVVATITNEDNAKKEVEFKVNDKGIEVPYVDDYKIDVPSGTAVKLNEVSLNNSIATKGEKVKELAYKKDVNGEEQTQTVEIPISLDSYNIPALLNTKYTLSLENNQGLSVLEDITLDKDYVIDELIAKEEVKNVFGDASKLFISTLIDSVVNQKEFDEINKLISPNSTMLDKIKTAYNDLKVVFSGQEVDGMKVTYEDYKLVDIAMNEVYVVDSNKLATLIQYNLEYKESKTLNSATISDVKNVQKVGVMTFEIAEDGNLLLDSSQGIFSLHQ